MVQFYFFFVDGSENVVVRLESSVANKGDGRKKEIKYIAIRL